MFASQIKRRRKAPEWTLTPDVAPETCQSSHTQLRLRHRVYHQKNEKIKKWSSVYEIFLAKNWKEIKSDNSEVVWSCSWPPEVCWGLPTQERLSLFHLDWQTADIMIYPSNLGKRLIYRGAQSSRCTRDRLVLWRATRRASADQKVGHIVSTTTAALSICSATLSKETICLHMKVQINTKNRPSLTMATQANHTSHHILL